LDLLRSAKGILKTDELTIDNVVFKLHYRVTVAILIGSSLIGVAKQYFGDPINCQTASGVNSKVLDDYCWIHSTFHIRNEYQGNVGCIVDPELVLAQQSYSGMSLYYDAAPRLPPSPSSPLTSSTPDTSFYQWVPFVLVLQAALFYIPRKIWKTCEGGLIASFGRDAKRLVILKGDFESGEEKGGGQMKEEIARKYSAYFQSILHHNNGYFLTFLVCEVLNLIIVVGNIYLTDFFLGGRFMKYGSQVLKYLSHDQVARSDLPNPMCTVFPTVTSCTFHSVGTAAGEQKFNSLCILSLNIVNEKVFLFLWFWFFGLTILTGMHLVFRLTCITIPPLRSMLLLGRARAFTHSDLATCRQVLGHCYLGDWFVLYQLCKNSNSYFFRYLLRSLEKSFNAKVKARQHSASRGGSYAKYGADELGRRSTTNGHNMEEPGRLRRKLVKGEGEEEDGAYPDLEP